MIGPHETQATWPRPNIAVDSCRHVCFGRRGPFCGGIRRFLIFRARVPEPREDGPARRPASQPPIVTQAMPSMTQAVDHTVIDLEDEAASHDNNMLLQGGMLENNRIIDARRDPRAPGGRRLQLTEKSRRTENRWRASMDCNSEVLEHN